MYPEPDPNQRHRIVFATWLAALYLGWVLTWCLHERVLPRWQDPSADALFWLFAKVVVWLAPVGWVLLREVRTDRPMEWIGFRSAPSVPLALGVALAWLGTQVAKDLAASTLPAVVPFDAALFNALVIAPLFEEAVFRGFALRYLVDGGARPAVAVGVTSAAWASLHVPGWLFLHVGLGSASLRFVGIAAFGVVLGALRSRSPSLFVPIFVHFINNAWHQGLVMRVIHLATR